MNYRNDVSQDQASAAGIGFANSLGLAAQQMQGCEARQSAKSRLRDRARRLRDEADELEALLKALPEELPRAADAALWNLAISQR